MKEKLNSSYSIWLLIGAICIVLHSFMPNTKAQYCLGCNGVNVQAGIYTWSDPSAATWPGCSYWTNSPHAAQIICPSEHMGVSIQTNYQAAVNLDSDGDGIPNIIENQLGLNQYGYNSPFGLSGANGLQVFTPLK